jgi:tetratricopeptide (TPR) repeat protein
MEKLRIFAASPSDMATERAKIETVVSMLKPLADYLDIVLDVVDWRAAVPEMGRPEQAILDQLKPTEWDVFIGILWHRFGTPPGGRDPQTQKDYLSGTEEEFKTAYRLWQQDRKPRIMMYRCMRAPPMDALDPDQLKRVKEFFTQFDAVKGEHPGLYKSFDATEAFEKLLHDNLQRLLLDYGEEIRGMPVAPEVVQAFAPKIPDNLPRRAPFFGRNRDLAIALRALSPEDRTWGVLVDGIGGIGKTALAVEAAYRTKERGLFDAFIFVSAKQNILAPGGIRELTPAARSLDEFLNETARVLGQPGIPQLVGQDKRRALLDTLRSTRSLLIYDNLETLTKEEQEALADFLRELPPGCKGIITSRRRGGEGAVWLRLEKLEWDAARAIIESEMERDARLAEKLRRAGEARWSELYDETKGSPLALVHTLGLLRVRAALTFDGALALLRGNRDPDLQNFIFQEARRELTTNDQTALRALALFAPSATFEAWMQVAELSRNALETTVDRLSALSLVDVLAGEERYALHPLTRNFVRGELLVDAQIAHEVGMRFARRWVAYAQQYGDQGNENYRTFDRLEAEWMNLDAAAEWLWQTAAVQGEKVGHEDAARRLNDLARALYGFLSFGGRWDELLRLHGRAYEAMHALNNWNEVGVRARDVAWIHWNRAETEEADRWADRCTEAWGHGGSKLEQPAGMRIRGLVAEQREDYDAAERYYHDALVIFRDLKMDIDVGTLLGDLGHIAQLRKQYDAAERYFREAFALAEKIGSKEGMATRYGNLGILALGRQRWAEARGWFEKALPLALEVGRQSQIAQAKVGFARIHEAEGRPDLALPLAQEALAIYKRLRQKDLAETPELVGRLMKDLGTE